jgi:hypothetical protein
LKSLFPNHFTIPFPLTANSTRPTESQQLI